MSLLKFFKSKSVSTSTLQSAIPSTNTSTSKEYEANKRKRSFVPNWTVSFPWVTFDGEKMFCATCKKLDVDNVFTTGSDNFRVSALQKHQLSETHTKCQLKLNADMSSIESSEAAGCLYQMQAATMDRVTKLFRMCHAIAKNGRPYTDFIWQCALQDSLGVDIGNAYRSDKECATFIHFIAEVERCQLSEVLDKVPFFSVVCDGSTDSSRTEQELIYVRYVHNGKVKTTFVSCESQVRANAENITASVISAFTECLDLKDWKTKLIGIGSDGAAVMMGSKTGVAKRLADMCEHKVTIVHCCAHRLELSMQSILQNSSYYTKLSQFLFDVFNFYHKSALMRATLKVTCEALGIKFLVPTRVGGTRWIAHVNSSLTNIRAILPALLTHCQEINQAAGGQYSPKARGISSGFAKVFKSKRFVLFAAFVQDLLSRLSRVSKMIQKTEVCLADVYTILEELKDNLQALKSRDGIYLREARQVTHVGDEEIDESRFVEADFEEEKQGILTSLLKGLDDRFGDITSVPAMRIADLHSWPLRKEALREFGNEEVADLCEEYAPILQHVATVEDIETEWTGLKTFVVNRFKTPADGNWEDIHLEQPNFPNVLLLIDFVRTLPGHSADCERGFSLLKKIKVDWRNRLTSSHLSDLMRATLLTPDIGAFDPSLAIGRWMLASKMGRRPWTKPYGRRTAENQDSGPDTDSDSDSQTVD